MRIGPAIAALALASCGDAPEAGAGKADRDVNESVSLVEPIAEDGTIECATGGRPLARNCTIERREGSRGLTLTIRDAEGGFRRLLLPRDGSGAVAADGAEPAEVTVLADGRAEVSIGGDRYRLPAAIGPERP